MTMGARFRQGTLRIRCVSQLSLSAFCAAVAAGCGDSGKSQVVLYVFDSMEGNTCEDNASRVGNVVKKDDRGSRHTETPYEKFMAELAASLRSMKGELNIDVCTKPTDGALDTVLNIEASNRYTAAAGREGDGRAYGIGLVQSDVLYSFSDGHHPQLRLGRTASNVRAVATAFEEWLIFCGRATDDEDRADSETMWEKFLRAEEVDAGPVGSGSMFTGLNLAQAVHPAWREHVHGRNDGGSTPTLRVIARDRSQKCDASRNDSLPHVFGMPESVAADLSGMFERGYRQVPSVYFCGRYGASQPGGKDRCDEEGQATIAVDATLVVDRELPGSVVHAIQCVLDIWDRKICTDQKDKIKLDRQALGTENCVTIERMLKNKIEEKSSVQKIKDTGYCETLGHGRIGSDDETSKVDPRFDNLPIRTHRTAGRRRLDGLSRAVLHINGWWMLAVLAGGSLFYIFREYLRYGKLSRSTALHEAMELAKLMRPILIGLVLGTAILTSAIWVAEFHSPDIHVQRGFLDGGVYGAMGWAFRFIFTSASNVAFTSASATIFFGIMKFFWTAGSITPTALAVRGVWMRYAAAANFTGHFVILGWNNQTGQLIEQLLEDDVDLVLVPFVDPPPLDHRVKVFEKKGGLSADVLRQAGFDRAKVVVVTADEGRAKGRGVSTDMHTLQLIQTYRQIEAEIGTRKTPVRIVAEVVNSEYGLMAKQIGLGRRHHATRWNASREVMYTDDLFQEVCSSAITTALLTEAIIHPSVEQVFEELLENNAGNEFYDVQVSALRRTFPFYSYNELRRVLARAVGEHAAVPVAIIYGPDNPDRPAQDVLLNPDYGAGQAFLHDDDAIVCIANTEAIAFRALQERLPVSRPRRALMAEGLRTPPAHPEPSRDFQAGPNPGPKRACPPTKIVDARLLYDVLIIGPPEDSAALTENLERSWPKARVLHMPYLWKSGFCVRFKKPPTVVVLQNRRASEAREISGDAYVLEVVRELRELEKKSGDQEPPTRIIAEVESSRSRALAYHIGVPDLAERQFTEETSASVGSDWIQVVCARKTANNLFAQVILKPRLEQVVKQLVQGRDDRDQVRLHEAVVGELAQKDRFSCYNDLQYLLVESRDQPPVTLLGVLYHEGDEIFRDSTGWARQVRPLRTCPNALEGARALCPNDRLIFLASHESDLDEVLDVNQL